MHMLGSGQVDDDLVAGERRYALVAPYDLDRHGLRIGVVGIDPLRLLTATISAPQATNMASTRALRIRSSVDGSVPMLNLASQLLVMLSMRSPIHSNKLAWRMT